jgi:cytochrome c peroxidase
MFQKLGVMKDYFAERKVKERDFGRYNVTHNEVDKFTFKVPSLRLAALTPPYFHNGTANTLKEAVDVMFEYQLGRTATDQEKDAIISFIKSLVGELKQTGVNNNVAK